MVLNVVKIGGAVLEDSRMRETFLKRFASLGGPAILVHGGGRTATDIAARLGVHTRMEGGRRITDADMLEVVTMVYGGLVNKRTVAELQSLGVNAIGLSGADLGCEWIPVPSPCFLPQVQFLSLPHCRLTRRPDS